jgi:hypothetical protein
MSLHWKHHCPQPGLENSKELQNSKFRLNSNQQISSSTFSSTSSSNSTSVLTTAFNTQEDSIFLLSNFRYNFLFA